MLLQLEWSYLQRNIPGVRSVMGLIEYAKREAFFPELFGGDEVSIELRKILGHYVKLSGLGIPDP